MSAARKPALLTEAEYLRIEDAADRKSEFYQGEMFLMAGAAPAHNYVKDNLVLELGTRLRGSGCRTASSDQRVRVPTGLYTYPDIVIVCGPREYAPQDDKALTNPRVVVEVLSPSTADYDRGAKLRQYQHIPSLAEVLLVAQDRWAAETFSRQPDGRWVYTAFDDPAGELHLASVNVRVPLAAVYRDTDVPERPPLRPHTRDDSPTRLDPPAHPGV